VVEVNFEGYSVGSGGSTDGPTQRRILFPLAPTADTGRPFRGALRAEGGVETAAARQLRADIQTLQAELNKELDALEDQTNSG
jgi:hypothetical protein